VQGSIIVVHDSAYVVVVAVVVSPVVVDVTVNQSVWQSVIHFVCSVKRNNAEVKVCSNKIFVILIRSVFVMSASAVWIVYD